MHFCQLIFGGIERKLQLLVKRNFYWTVLKKSSDFCATSDEYREFLKGKFQIPHSSSGNTCL